MKTNEYTARKEEYEKHEEFVGHFLSKERTCAKKGMKVKEKRKRNVRGVFLFSPLFNLKNLGGEKKKK